MLIEHHCMPVVAISHTTESSQQQIWWTLFFNSQMNKLILREKRNLAVSGEAQDVNPGSSGPQVHMLNHPTTILGLSSGKNPKPGTRSPVQSLSHVRLFATPGTATHQASLSITNSWSLLKLMSIESVMPSNYLILCHPLLLVPSISSSIRVHTREPEDAQELGWARTTEEVSYAKNLQTGWKGLQAPRQCWPLESWGESGQQHWCSTHNVYLTHFLLRSPLPKHRTCLKAVLHIK